MTPGDHTLEIVTLLLVLFLRGIDEWQKRHPRNGSVSLQRELQIAEINAHMTKLETSQARVEEQISGLRRDVDRLIIGAS